MGSLRNIIRNGVTYPWLTDFATRILPPAVTIFMLHRIAIPDKGIDGIDPAYLHRCLDYLQKNNYRFISLEDAIKRALANELGKEKWVAFSLDDGFEEQVRIGSEIFQRFDCPSTCFLITDFVDGKFWPWDYKLMYLAKNAKQQIIDVEVEGQTYRMTFGAPDTEAFLLRFARHLPSASVGQTVQRIAEKTGVIIPETPPPELQPTSWTAVREAEQLGMQFAPHSASHFILSRTDDESLRDEITRSAQRIREECAKPANVFCYPSGKADEFDSRSINIVRRCGFTGAVSAEPGYMNQPGLTQHVGYRFALPRLPLPEDSNELKLYVSWAQRVREHMTATPLRQFYTS